MSYTIEEADYQVRYMRDEYLGIMCEDRDPNPWQKKQSNDYAMAWMKEHQHEIED
jgi:hypothetical protein